MSLGLAIVLGILKYIFYQLSLLIVVLIRLMSGQSSTESALATDAKPATFLTYHREARARWPCTCCNLDYRDEGMSLAAREQCRALLHKCLPKLLPIVSLMTTRQGHRGKGKKEKKGTFSQTFTSHFQSLVIKQPKPCPKRSQK